MRSENSALWFGTWKGVDVGGGGRRKEGSSAIKSLVYDRSTTTVKCQAIEICHDEKNRRQIDLTIILLSVQEIKLIIAVKI